MTSHPAIELLDELIDALSRSRQGKADPSQYLFATGPQRTPSRALQRR